MKSTLQSLNDFQRSYLLKQYAEFYDRDIKSNKWQNLYFLKSGKSWLGFGIHPTENMAYDAAVQAFTDKQKKPEHIIENLMPEQYKMKELSHCIQIPVKE